MKGRPKIELAGQRFEKLTVLTFFERKNNRSLWICECDCGKLTSVDTSDLRRGKVKSCGCSPYKLPEGESILNTIIYGYKASAKRRNISYELSKEEFKELTRKNCSTCGQKPQSDLSKTRHSNGTYIYNGIDRINNTKGYTIDNVQTMCQKCNFLKGRYNFDEFKVLIKNIYEYLKLNT